MSPQKEEPRYDNVRITKIVEGTTIEGHDAVKRHLEQEQKLLAEYGASIIFQVYRLNLQADTLEDLQGDMLAEIKVEGSNFTSGTATVEVAKYKLRLMLEELAETQNGGQAPVALAIDASDHLTLYLSGRPIQDDTAFYSDNYIMLPVWIQALVHRCESKEAVELINKLAQKR